MLNTIYKLWAAAYQRHLQNILYNVQHDSMIVKKIKMEIHSLFDTGNSIDLIRDQYFFKVKTFLFT